MVVFFRLNFAASNPAVFTDGYCYLDWIAEQYNLKVKCETVLYCNYSAEYCYLNLIAEQCNHKVISESAFMYSYTVRHLVGYLNCLLPTGTKNTSTKSAAGALIKLLTRSKNISTHDAVRAPNKLKIGAKNIST